jgi:hypothetical protein
MKKLRVDPNQGYPFFGKSRSARFTISYNTAHFRCSGYQLLQTALDIRKETHGNPRRFHETLFQGCKRPELWEHPPVCFTESSVPMFCFLIISFSGIQHGKNKRNHEIIFSRRKIYLNPWSICISLKAIHSYLYCTAQPS